MTPAPALDEAALLSDRVGVMSARPGRVAMTVAGDRLHNIADYRIASDPGFGAITARLWSAVHRSREHRLGARPRQPVGGAVAGRPIAIRFVDDRTIDNSRTTVVACHSPPRGARMPRLLSSSAILRTLVVP
jgi:hypothetical protein